MDLTKLAAMFACVACGRAGARLHEGSHLACDGCGRCYPLAGKSVQTAPAVPLSDAWKRKQTEGETRYRRAARTADDDATSRLFGGFIAATLPRDAVTLDIGSGIGTHLPPYVSELALPHYLGLEPLAAAAPRTYPCLAGAVVEKIPLADGTVDAVLFATSLDHIEHPDRAFTEVRRVLAGGGRLYFWVGLYDPDLMARTRTYHHTLFTGSLPRRLARLAFLHLVYARFAQHMLVRKYKLSRNQPLDEKHFRYYTRATLLADLERHGLAVSRKLLVPGTNSMFIEARFP